MTNRDPIKNWGRVNRIYTDNIGDQVKKKLKEQATGASSKTGKGEQKTHRQHW